MRNNQNMIIINKTNNTMNNHGRNNNLKLVKCLYDKIVYKKRVVLLGIIQVMVVLWVIIQVTIIITMNLQSIKTNGLILP